MLNLLLQYNHHLTYSYIMRILILVCDLLRGGFGIIDLVVSGVVASGVVASGRAVEVDEMRSLVVDVSATEQSIGVGLRGDCL